MKVGCEKAGKGGDGVAELRRMRRHAGEDGFRE